MLYSYQLLLYLRRLINYNTMSTGKVKFFNQQKGFGFIVDDETGADVFVHVTGVTDRINDNDKVSFDIVEDRRGKKAINVKLI